MTDRWGKTSVVICAPDRQVRVRAGWGKAFGNHTPRTPHTLARNLESGRGLQGRPYEAVGFQPTHWKQIQQPPRHKLTKGETLACASPLWESVGGDGGGGGGGEGPSTGPDNCFHFPCQDSRAWGAFVWGLCDELVEDIGSGTIRVRCSSSSHAL